MSGFFDNEHLIHDCFIDADLLNLLDLLLFLEEEWRDWVGSNEPTESSSTLNKDSVFLHLTFTLQQVNFQLKQHNAGKFFTGT